MPTVIIPKYIKTHAQLKETIEKTCWNIHKSYQVLQSL